MTVTSEKLAVNGGEKTVPDGLAQPWPQVTEADKAAVMEVLVNTSSTGTPGLSNQQAIQMGGLAREWCEYQGVQYCIPVNSGTAALHMCVSGVDCGPGDEVILPAFTFWASAAAVLHACAIPVFVDIEPGTFCMDPKAIEAAITPYTKAIMPVHIHGMPCDMDPILAIAAEHNLKVIEDCAQSHGARYKGKLVGTFGDAAGFSNQVSKPLSSGCQGGLFTTNDEAVWVSADHLQYFGERVVPGRERDEQQYNAHALSYMYRGDMFAQAFVRSQLKRLDEMNAQRIANCEYLSEQIKDIPGISPPVMRPDAQTVYFNYIVGFNAEELGLTCSNKVLRDKAIEALNAEGMCVGLWQRRTVPAQEVFQNPVGFGKGVPWSLHERKVDYDPGQFPVANKFLDDHVYIFDICPPNGTELMDYYTKAIRKVMAGIRDIIE